MQEFTTPMMKQYLKIKQDYQGCLLFFRLGDFYELFLEDARIGAEILNITLTSRPRGKDGRIPMAGVPYHAVDSYLSKLVQAGYKVAICEQVTLPNKYGIVDREVIRVVTPGTVLDEKALEKKTNNFIISLTYDKNLLAMAIADVSTGYLAVMENSFESLESSLKNELSKINPSECILPEPLYNNPELLKILKSQKGLNIYCFHDWEMFASNTSDFLKNYFHLTTLESFGIEQKMLTQQAASSLLGYLEQTQKSHLPHIKKIISLSDDEYLQMDRSTMINLELFSTIREHDTRGSLLSILDHTQTAMGGRLLKSWICKPLKQREDIEKRLDAVESLIKDASIRENLSETLKHITDIERLLSRLSLGLGNARDLINLKESLLQVLQLKQTLNQLNTLLLAEIKEMLPDQIDQLIKLINTQIISEPPIAVKEGGIFKRGVNQELDLLYQNISSSKDYILNLEKVEREKTGISSLKVRFNKVFGFYIEISKSNLSLVPKEYIRKQTLVGGERFITSELKVHEEIILTAEEKINELEYKLFLKLLEKILSFTEVVQLASKAVAIIDCLVGFSILADQESYIKPKLLYSGEIKIKQGRHPVVEKLLEDKSFVPNDVEINSLYSPLLLITGPNMAGKSVFIRQIALLVLMTQIGSFIPAQSAQISIVDRIFVRSGASDVITSGLSTFMVEMVETAYILHHATKNSLIVMDEIGRGTSTYDGISLAWAIAEYLVSKLEFTPKTLFATHYHELQALEHHYPKLIKNFHLAVENESGTPIFLYTLMPGGASHSFGLAVAKLAGIPQVVVDQAMQLLKVLESRNVSTEENFIAPITPQLKSQSPDEELIERLIIKEIEKLDIHQLTPLEALNTLANLKDKLKLLYSGSRSKLDFDA